MSLGKRGQQAQTSPAQVLSTLGGQHGTCCLLEVQKLLQEQDGLVERSHTEGQAQQWLLTCTLSNQQGRPVPGVCRVTRTTGNFRCHPWMLAT